MSVEARLRSPLHGATRGALSARRLTLLATACSALLSGLLLTAACAPEVTSVGEWSPPQVWYFEAESGELSGGFAVNKDTTASEDAYIDPPEAEIADDAPGTARASYEFSLSKSGEFTLWGRIRSPGASTNRLWFQVDGGTWYRWRISVGDIWYWDDLHDDTDYGSPLVFPLDAGEHELVVANCVPGVGLDRLRVSAVDEPPPENQTACKPPHSIELGGECLPSCGSQRGTMCGEAACDGRTILTAYDCDICCQGEL